MSVPSNPPAITIAALIAIPGLAALLYLGQVTLDIYFMILGAILGLYGIQGVLKTRTITSLDLFPGVISDQYLIGIDALVTSGVVFQLGLMTANQFIGLAIMILGALHLLRSATK